jgi:hypothetical protein
MDEMLAAAGDRVRNERTERSLVGIGGSYVFMIPCHAEFPDSTKSIAWTLVDLILIQPGAERFRARLSVEREILRYFITLYAFRCDTRLWIQD